MRKRLTAFMLAFLMPLVTLLGMVPAMETNAAAGAVLPIICAGILVVLLAAPQLLKFSESGPGSKPRTDFNETL